MKNIFKVAVAVMFLCLLVLPVYVEGSDLDSFIKKLNAQAEADLPGFKANLSAQFGVPVPQVDVLIKSVDRPGDAYMCLRVGQIARQPTEVVVKEYRAHKGKGWGVIAKNLGIKPGSKEFHELKRGDLGPGSKSDDGKGKGKGKGKDKDSGPDFGGGKGKGHKK
ncbi:MAG: hypothetical protein Q7T83_10025 [Thermodesulfovibrionales bacterium]|nr:hypothetical protein [Thermodesulfovibrionales bacterium]MDP3111058.1 hypothetical protein [Thermodesulfovibrionales bacterium]